MLDDVATGLDRILADRSALLRGRRFGLLMNRASVTSQLVPAEQALARKFPGQLHSLFSPQHGYWSEQQANMVESAHVLHPRLHVPVHSLYAESRRPTQEMLDGFDVLVIDLQDVGTRVYTFIWTMKYCLEACAQAGRPVIVLDRPNPVGGVLVEGPVMEQAYRSFVGEFEIPMRHALTVGELALLMNAELDPPCELTVVPCTGWNPNRIGYLGRRPWVAPSPNMPTVATATVYPGQVLLEGTTLSEGRGTTTPFEFVGAPGFQGDEVIDLLESCCSSGVRFLASQFTPSFDKFAGDSCGGVAILVTEPMRFHSLRTTLQILACCRQRYPEQVSVLPPPYEYETVLPPIDIISGSSAVREWLEKEHCDPREVPKELWLADLDDWENRTAAHRLYERQFVTIEH